MSQWSLSLNSPRADGLGVGVGAAEEVFGELGKLAGAEEALAVDHEGRQDFGVAVLGGVQVEHEADEGALEAGACAHVDGEARAGELGGALEVENAEGFAELPVGLGGEVEGGIFAPGFDGDVVGFGCAGGDFVAGEVGNAGERQAHLLVESGGGLVELVEAIFEGAGFFHQSGRGFT